jgi:hypothetical protein
MGHGGGGAGHGRADARVAAAHGPAHGGPQPGARPAGGRGGGRGRRGTRGGDGLPAAARAGGRGAGGEGCVRVHVWRARRAFVYTCAGLMRVQGKAASAPPAVGGWRLAKWCAWTQRRAPLAWSAAAVHVGAAGRRHSSPGEPRASPGGHPLLTLQLSGCQWPLRGGQRPQCPAAATARAAGLPPTPRQPVRRSSAVPDPPTPLSPHRARARRQLRRRTRRRSTRLRWRRPQAAEEGHRRRRTIQATAWAARRCPRHVHASCCAALAPCTPSGYPAEL